MSNNVNNNDNQNAEYVRRWVTQRLIALRSFLSTLPEGHVLSDKLRGPEGEKRAARILKKISEELGLKLDTSLEDARSRVRQSVAGVFTSEANDNANGK